MGSLSTTTESAASIPDSEPRQSLPVLRPSVPATFQQMSKVEIAEAMRLQTPVLVAEILAQVRLMMAEETARQTRIESKAQSLLAAVGLSLTVVTAVLAKTGSLWVRVPFGLFIAGALAAALFALNSMRIQGYERISENTVLDGDVLDRADNIENPDDALSLYRRNLVPNLYDTYNKSIETNDKRAKWVEKGQFAFGVSMIVVGLGAFIMILTGAKL